MDAQPPQVVHLERPPQYRRALVADVSKVQCQLLETCEQSESEEGATRRTMEHGEVRE